jgi:hypothetical protein
MSKYTTYYNTRQDMYRDFATNWASITSTMDLTERQRRGMALFFKPIARRFGLTKEFKDIGVI